MKIYVKYNDVARAYKILTKRLNDEGVFKTLKSKEFFQSKAQKTRAKKKVALARFRKDQRKRRAVEARIEEKHVLYSKKAGLPQHRR